MIIIKPRDCKHGRPQSRPSPPPPSPQKKFWGHIGGLFCYFFFIWRPFATFFSFLGAFSPCGGLSATFYFMMGAFFRLAPPPRYENFRERPGSRACSPVIFLCDRNLLSSGHVLLRFCLRNDKNNDKCTC